MRTWLLGRYSVFNAGYLVLAAMLLSLLTIVDTGFALISAFLYWLAAIRVLPSISRRNLKQVVVLLMIGGLTTGYSLVMGADYNMIEMLSGNVPIVSMLVAVSFLTALGRPNIDDSQRLPQGRRSMISTYLGVHLFGAVINISAMIIYGDRMGANRSISRSQLIVLSRGFTAAALWSPFFAAMAVALSYAPQANVLLLILLGLGLTGVGLTYTYVEQLGALEKQPFYGYPLHAASLWLPVLLTLLVFVFHHLFAQLSILFIITLCSPFLSFLVFAVRRTVKADVAVHVENKLQKMGNEIVLFLSAGIFGYGLKLLLALQTNVLWFEQFDALTASVCFAVIVLLAMFGFHMLIGISIIAPLVLPLSPDPTMLAFVFLAAWSLGSAASPLSGVNITIQSNYGVSGNTLLRWNLGYVLLMSCAIVAVLFLLEYGLVLV